MIPGESKDTLQFILRAAGIAFTAGYVVIVLAMAIIIVHDGNSDLVKQAMQTCIWIVMGSTAALTALVTGGQYFRSLPGQTQAPQAPQPAVPAMPGDAGQ